MVEIYWNIEKSIIEKQGDNDKTKYDTDLIKELPKQMAPNIGF